MVVIPVSSRIPFEAFYIPDRFALKAQNELLETEENRSAAIAQLKKFVTEEKDLLCRISDEFLLMFLRARKFNVARAFSLLKKFVNFKRKNIGIFTNIDYEPLSKLIKSKTLTFLPERDEDGCVILAVHLGNWNTSQVSIEDLKKAIVLFLYHSVCDPLTQINGYKVLFDVKSHPLKHLRYATPYNIYLLYSGTQECFPGRFKGIHIINMSLTFKAGWTIVQPFLSEKLKSRIIFHSDDASLHKHFSIEMLPVDFGGQSKKECETISWVKNALTKEHLEKLAN